MRKLTLATLVVLAFGMVSWAEDVPKFEVFGGFSYLRVGSRFFEPDAVNTTGWGAQATGNINKFLGVTADVSGQYKTFVDVPGAHAKGTVYNFLFGPTVSYRTSRLRPFGHALFGVSHASAEEVITAFASRSDSDNAFAMAFGGGVDMKVVGILSARLGQVDWLRTNFWDDSQNHFRFQTGVVLNLGSK